MPEALQSLDDRIASGEFSDVGSTKEQMTRPLRRLLARDPVGIGEHCYRTLLGWNTGLLAG